MDNFSAGILHHRRWILSIFLLALLICGFLATKVQVNYDLTAYVPEDAPSTRALKEIEKDFEDRIPNLELLVPRIEIADALNLKTKLAQLPEVENIQWLDDQADPGEPVETLDASIREAFYQDKNALFQITLNTSDYAAALRRIRALAGDDSAMAGQAVDLARAGLSVSEEMTRILMISVPAAFVILLLVTTSWFEPILFMITIMAGVLLNMGTNLLIGRISFITQSVGAVLQLAVSMDYSIFILHRFGEYRRSGDNVEKAMEKAISNAFSTVTASALTTVFGFLCLVFMRFRIGPDLGIVLAKGIFFSLVTVLFLLPSLTLMTVRLVDRSTHRSLLPSRESFNKLGRFSLKIGPVILLIVLITSLPLWRAQNANHFLYGMGSYPLHSREERDKQTIEKYFGAKQRLLLLVPVGEPAKEEALGEALRNVKSVDSVMSYASLVGNQIPDQVLPEEDRKMLRSDRYSRFIVVADLPSEGSESFAAAETLRALSSQYYGDAALWAGTPFSLTDMRDTVRSDNRIVNGLAILCIGLVLLLTFRSLSLPFILVFCIEYAIWCNLAIPYFCGVEINYIGYLVISTIQLGATVDYAILLSQNYRDYRLRLTPREAAAAAVGDAVPAILPPALILSMAGFTLFSVSSIPVVLEIGLVLGRGALLSLATVIFLLPNLLRLLDPLIRHTSLPVREGRTSEGKPAGTPNRKEGRS